ncbi:MAG: hypothetical protein K0S07_1256 [Chlamydiales bacterium]|jgi:hypothetical protein|nr:hypothetical protein [Chlamydiales bacterium]
MNKETHLLEDKINRLEPFVEQLLDKNLEERFALVEQDVRVHAFFQKREDLKKQLSRFNLQQNYLLKVCALIEQSFAIFGQGPMTSMQVENLLNVLQPVEHFYRQIGGVAGYYLRVLKLILQHKLGEEEKGLSRYLKPAVFDVRQNSQDVRQAILWGIEHLKTAAAIFPVGGAGDRLNLQDANQEPLPAALLSFCGITLLEGLIREVEGWEALYFQLKGQKITLPIALMTSHEKNNHTHILRILESQQWFGRGPESFFLMVQPLVPVITEEGEWLMKKPGIPFLKPGGHGALWKVSKDAKLFEWLEGKGCDHVFIRQINNPLGGLDYGYLPLLGLGGQHQKAFGFASCQRRLNSQEGMNVIVERGISGEGESGFTYALTNIEYTEFTKGVQEHPFESYDDYPCNTNILFANLKAVKEAVERDPLPGALVNLKSTAPYADSSGEVREVRIARLESTMQNIADTLKDTSSKQLDSLKWNTLSSFATFAERQKTISSAKRSFAGDIEDTPEKAFYDLQTNYRQILELAGVDMPKLTGLDSFLARPPFYVYLHPLVGPLYDVIRQKIAGGKLSLGSELQLSAHEVHLKNVQIQGSLCIQATALVDYSESIAFDRTGRVELIDVSIANEGLKPRQRDPIWQNQLEREGLFSLTLFGNAEFYAEGVAFHESEEILVEDGWRMSVFKEGGQRQIVKEKIEKSSWRWTYALTDDLYIALKKSPA